MPRRPLLTERDVLRARRDGATSLDAAGALVTPAARDAAVRHGIALTGDRAGTGAGAMRRGSIAAPKGEPVPTPTVPGTSPGSAMRVAIGADHGGVAMKDALLAFLRERGATVQDVGTFGADAVDYPDFAIAVARAVSDGGADVGIMVDGAGIGSCMAANKVAGVRAAMCHDVTTASNAREHNNANVLTLGGTLIGARLALEIARTFLDTPFAGGRHAKRVDKIDALDRARHAPDRARHAPDRARHAPDRARHAPDMARHAPDTARRVPSR